MNVQCPECQSVFRVDPTKVPPTGVRARCSVCGGILAVSTGTTIDEEFAPPRPGAVASRTSRPVHAPSGPAQPRSYDTPTVPFHAMPPTPPSSAPTQPSHAPPSAPEAQRTTKPLAAAASAPAPLPTAPPNKATPSAERSAAPTGERPTAEPPAASRSASTSGSTPSPRSTLFPPRPTMSTPAAGGPAVTPAARPAGLPPRPTPAMPPTNPSLRGAPITPPLPRPPAGARPSSGNPIQPSALSRPSAPSAGAPSRAPINPFLANDPNAKARRLSRALISDLVTYFPQRREEGLREGTLRELFREEIKKSYDEYTEQVGREFAESTTHFQEALNDILAGGQKIF